MAVESGPNYKDSSTAANIPVDALIRTVSPTAPTAGQSVRQVVALGDGSDTANYATIDSQGNLHVITTPQVVAATAGTITTATSAITFTGATPLVMITIHGTYAGVNATFESSDDSAVTYYPAAAIRSDSTGGAESVTGVLANVLRMWVVNVAGATNFRVRATAWTSGTATVRITPVNVSTEPNPVVTIGASNVTIPISYTQAALVAGAALIGKVGIDQTTPGTTNAVLQGAVGQGALTAVPAGTTNGTAVGSKPGLAVGVMFYIPSNGTLNVAIATSAPVAAPLALVYTNPNGVTPLEKYFDLSGTAQAYITAMTGSCLFRWI